jgi:hypothetical protein
MPTTNLYFNNYQISGEQNLLEDLITESIKIYGVEVYYLPRTLVNKDNLFHEDVLSKFETAYPIEMYVKNVDGFEGDGDFMSKFGLEMRDEMTLTVSRRRFGEEINWDETTEDIGRPAEGDLIYFPLNKRIFEVKFVEDESIFYQLGGLNTYDLTVELFEYSHEKIDTGIPAIDEFEDALSGDMEFFQLLTEAGDALVFETGDHIINETYRVEDTDKLANNEFIQTQTKTLDFIDFSEINPFSEGGSW